MRKSDIDNCKATALKMVIDSMKAKKIRSTDLAKAMDMSDSLLCHVLKGRRNLTPDLVDKLSNYLDFDANTKAEFIVYAARGRGWDI